MADGKTQPLLISRKRNNYGRSKGFSIKDLFKGLRREKSLTPSQGNKNLDVNDVSVVTVLVHRNKPNSVYISYVERQIKEQGVRVFFFLAGSGEDLEHAQALAEFFKVKGDILEVNRRSVLENGQHITRGLVALYKPNSSVPSKPKNK